MPPVGESGLGVTVTARTAVSAATLRPSNSTSSMAMARTRKGARIRDSPRSSQLLASRFGSPHGRRGNPRWYHTVIDGTTRNWSSEPLLRSFDLDLNLRELGIGVLAFHLV